MRTAVYVRISRDSTGEGLGVERQEEDCRALCDRKGWKVDEGRVYCDNDVSAFSGKRRPAYEAMWDAARGGDIDAVVCWDLDRLTRSLRELEDIIDLADRYHLELATCGGDLDVTTPDGRGMARMRGVWARMEMEKKSRRQKRANRQSAEAGKVAGGGTRAFGFKRDGKTIDVAEAAVIREVARRLLAGESQNSLTRDLAERGIRTSAGNPWVPVSLRQMMTSARISGRREHLGEIVSDTADWPAIITPADSDRLRSMLKNTARASGAPITYLLSGLLVCGRCGYPMIGKSKAGTPPSPRYLCRKLPGQPGRCGGIVTNAARTDELVREMVLYRLDSPAVKAALRSKRTADPKLQTELDQLQARRVSDLDLLDAGSLTQSEFRARSKTQLARIEWLEAQIARADGPDPLGAFVGTYQQMSDRWVLANQSQRRAVVNAVIEKIKVGPAKPEKGVRGHWDPSRFDVVWVA